MQVTVSRERMSEILIMRESQRMTPSLSEEFTLQQAKMRKGVGGFSLIELMAVVAIISILVGIVMGGQSQLLSKNKVDGAVERIKSTMVAARLNALSTGVSQYVGIDVDAEAYVSSLDGISTYSGGAWNAGAAWTKLEGVNLLNSNAKGQAGVAQQYELFSFSSRGTAAGGSILVQAVGAAKTGKVIIVNGITGRSRTEECADLGTCQ